MFPNDGTCVIKMEYSEEEISAVVTESRQAQKQMQKLVKVTETVAVYRLREMKNLQAVEKLATWRRTFGYDRVAADNYKWASRPLPLTPEQFTQSLWSELNTLRDAISMLEEDGFNQRAKSFIKEIGQRTVNSTDAIGQSTAKLMDAEFVTLKRFVEKGDRDEAHATVAPVDTAQYRSPRSLTPEIPSDLCVYMEKKEAGMMDPKQDQLESSSARTGLETPGQQCSPNGETEQTTADGYLLVGMGSNQGGDTSPTTECVGTRAGTTTTPANSLSTTFLKASRQPIDNEKGSEENKQFDPGGEGEKPPPWNATVIVLLFFFLEGTLGRGMPAVCASCSSYVCAFLSAHCLLFYQVIIFLAS